ncbi:prolyl oligopeptidase family serine peptidase [Roseomonas arctica]|uniref:Prolyl oligopeptidase family serine peptidase n=1 Tax=Plastoroseomonas arctica TaxID=1509237 RepID=A0AAF1K195_9PROT|nr:prolyl oligopeptidase family serine peptidase [Plastoroseomonas arctica]
MLTGPSIPPADGGKAKKLVVILHGLGANGNDLIGIGHLWGRSMPNAAFLAYDAPDPMEGIPMGRQWFDLYERDPARMIELLRNAARGLFASLDAELARLGLEDDDLAITGFSQGAMLALFAGLRRPNAPAALVGFSGALLVPEALVMDITVRPPVLLIHGEDDGVVPPKASRDAAETMRDCGVTVHAHIQPGLDHTIDQQGIDIAASFLQHGFAEADRKRAERLAKAV